MNFRSQKELTRWALEASHLFLFLDYDGTLVDFAPTPDQLQPNPLVNGLLERLAKSRRITTAIISGRPLSNLRLLLPISGLWLGGTYGLELRSPSGETICRADYEELRPRLEPVRDRWQALISGRKGFYLEDKGFTLALHARFAQYGEAEEVLAAARLALNSDALGEGFRILGGQRFLEVAPPLATKREAVAYLLDQPRYRPGPNRQDLRGTLARQPHPGAQVLYIGDDDRDEEAFPLVHEHGGAAVKVASPEHAFEPTEADFIFETPQETVRWLEKLVSPSEQ